MQMRHYEQFMLLARPLEREPHALFALTALDPNNIRIVRAGTAREHQLWRFIVLTQGENFHGIGLWNIKFQMLLRHGSEDNAAIYLVPTIHPQGETTWIINPPLDAIEGRSYFPITAFNFYGPRHQDLTVSGSSPWLENGRGVCTGWSNNALNQRWGIAPHI